MSDTQFFPDVIRELPEFEHNFKGLESHILQCEGKQIIFMSFEEETIIPEHSHEAQWAVVLDGRIELTVEGELHIYMRGDTYYLPAGIKHSAVIRKGYKDVTLFNQSDRYKVKVKD